MTKNSFITIFKLYFDKGGVRLRYSKETLDEIWRRTQGRCHICGKKLYRKYYGEEWHVDHSKPRAKGGTNHFNNYFPACSRCNSLKGKKSSRTARSWFGRKRAPYSKQKEKEIRHSNGTSGAIIGVFIGHLIERIYYKSTGQTLGPWGKIICGAFGAKIAYDLNPDNQ